MKTIEVEILGKKYYFKTDNPVKLREHAEYLDSQLEELYEKAVSRYIENTDFCTSYWLDDEECEEYEKLFKKEWGEL